MTHGTQGQQWIDDEIRKAEKMTDKVDISPEAVETRALCHDQFVGCDYDMTMTQDGHQKTASTLRAQAARIAELEAAIKRQAGAAKTLRNSTLAEVQHIKDNERKEYLASKTLDSERDANAILTEENEALQARIAELEAERDETMREALSLARSLHKTHYSDVTQWEPLDYPAGIISQIDNMVAGIVARAEAAEAKLAKAANGLTAIEKQYYMEASNPSPAFIRQIAAKMNGIARDTQDTLAELKGDNATPTTHRQRDRDFHRYVDGDIHDTAERYYKATLEAERNAVASLNRCLREKDAAMSTLFRLLDEHSIDYSHLIS